MLGCAIVPSGSDSVGRTSKAHAAKAFQLRIDPDYQSDMSLCSDFIGGDQQAFAALYERYHERLLRRLYYSYQLKREIAEEVLQDVWLAVAKQKAMVWGKFYPWLVTIARNYAVNYLENRKRMRERYKPLAEYETVDPCNGVDADLCQDEEDKALHSAISQLPAEQRQAIRLTFFVGLSIPKAAKLVGVSAETFRYRLKKAKERLRFALA